MFILYSDNVHCGGVDEDAMNDKRAFLHFIVCVECHEPRNNIGSEGIVPLG